MDAMLKKVNKINNILREAEIYFIRAYRGATKIRFRQNDTHLIEPVSEKFALEHLEMCSIASEGKAKAVNEIKILLTGDKK